MEYTLNVPANAFIQGINGEAAKNTEGQIHLFDITQNARMGVRGTKAAPFLEQEGIALPIKPNSLTVLPQGVVVLRLSQTEHWLVDISGEAGEGLSALDSVARDQTDLYSLFCQHSHAAFTLTGDFLPECFAKVCAVDVSDSAFIVGSIAQTSVARVNCILAKFPWKGKNCFLVLSDITSSAYLWDALIDAKSEFMV